MSRTFAGLALWVFAAAAQAQTGTPATPGGAPPVDSGRANPTLQTPTSGPAAPGSQTAPQRGFIAPIVDIRIKDEGISLPRGVGESAEKPPAK